MPLARLCILALIPLLAAGCRHYTGYVQQHVETTPDKGPSRQEFAPAPEPIRLIGLPTAQSGAIEFRAVQREIIRRPVTRQVTARRTYVRYHWSVWLAKPLAWISLYLPFYMPYADPHNHGGGNWNQLNYWRDVLAYYNLFEANPNGSQRIEDEWTVLSAEQTLETVIREEAPLPGAPVQLLLGSQPLAQALTSPEGVARFDLRRVLTPEIAATAREFTLDLIPGRAGSAKTFTLPDEVLQTLLQPAP